MLVVGYFLSALYISLLVSGAENLFSVSFWRQQFGTQIGTQTAFVSNGEKNKTVSIKYITIFVYLSDHNLQRCESKSKLWISQEVLCCRHLNIFSHRRKISLKKSDSIMFYFKRPNFNMNNYGSVALEVWKRSLVHCVCKFVNVSHCLCVSCVIKCPVLVFREQ